MSCLTLLAFAFYHPTLANPTQVELLDSRDPGTGDSSIISPKTWVPMVVIVVLLIIVALLAWSKNSFRRAFSAFVGVDAGTSSGSNPTTGGRVLTAEQLAGSDSATELPRQPRRNRRARRTPSQMSVTSLPAYNKEPGDEELVIFRSRDLEEGAMMSATHTEEEDSSLISQDHSQVSRHTPMPTLTTNEMPYMHDVEHDISSPTLLSSHARQSSSDSSLQETRSLMRLDSNLPHEMPDPRGEAPAYFEVVDQDQESNPGLSGTHPSPNTSETLPEPQQRRSGFRTFLNRMSMMSHVPEHRRAESDQSSISNGHRSNRSTPSSASNHRPTQSSSSPSMFRTISRQRSNQTLNSSVHLNSPSLISLNSISSPLSHTLIRTEFTYPKSGPTAQQLKVISSRENFSRFGMPYGPDAIAFAASSSRQDLEPPPPDFEASSSQLSLARPGLSGSAVVGDTQGRPSISERAADREAGTQSSEAQKPEIGLSNASTDSTPSITRNGSSTTSPSISDPTITLTDPSSSSTSTRSQTVLPLLPPANEFGKLYTSSLAPQDATSRSRSESRASNFSFQSYATAPETETGYINGDDADSRPSTPRLGGRTS